MSIDLTMLSGNLVGLGGFEPPTSPLSGVRSNQLSYRPGIHRPDLHLVVKKVAGLWSLVIGLLKRQMTNDVRQTTSSCVLYIRIRLACVGTCAGSIILFKEVIQPQVPLRLPCYDFTPVMNHKVVSALPKVKLPTSFAAHSHGVTGGVYKARERIHRDMLIRDY